MRYLVTVIVLSHIFASALAQEKTKRKRPFGIDMALGIGGGTGHAATTAFSITTNKYVFETEFNKIQYTDKSIETNARSSSFLFGYRVAQKNHVMLKALAGLGKLKGSCSSSYGSNECKEFDPYNKMSYNFAAELDLLISKYAAFELQFLSVNSSAKSLAFVNFMFRFGLIKTKQITKKK